VSTILTWWGRWRFLAVESWKTIRNFARCVRVQVRPIPLEGFPPTARPFRVGVPSPYVRGAAGRRNDPRDKQAPRNLAGPEVLMRPVSPTARHPSARAPAHRIESSAPRIQSRRAGSVCATKLEGAKRLPARESSAERLPGGDRRRACQSHCLAGTRGGAAYAPERHRIEREPHIPAEALEQVTRVLREVQELNHSGPPESGGLLESRRDP
jgi:hypothetical protein